MLKDAKPESFYEFICGILNLDRIEPTSLIALYEINCPENPNSLIFMVLEIMN